jgi:hypothetical protein
MKIVKYSTALIVVFLFFAGYAAFSQQADKSRSAGPELNTYLIERDIPDVGKFTPEQLKGISQKSCSVIKELGPDIIWLQSYVTASKLYCVYKAKDEKIIREHGSKGGFPITSITMISGIISPETAK